MSPQRPALAPRPRTRGFSLIEMLIGLVVGLLCTLVISTVLAVAEGQRRGTTAGADAQVSGSLALYTVQRDLAEAGYGFASEPNALGCELTARFNGAAVPELPARLVPVLITQGGATQADEVRILASSKRIDGSGAAGQVGYSLPTRAIPPHYSPSSPDPARSSTFNVWSTLGMRVGDLMVAVVNADQPCGLFEVRQPPASDTVLALVAEPSRWNAPGHPATAMQDRCAASGPCAPVNTSGSLLVNLGQLVDLAYSIDAQQRLVVSRLDTATLTRTVEVVQDHIVMLRALYGRDTDGNGAVDTYDYATPTNAAGWAGVLSVRLAVVARSIQFEREEVTTADPQWDVGSGASVQGSAPCGASRCVPLPVAHVADWRHFRYQVFDLVVPLRNQRWKS